ncbi:uncharacterized protein LOC142220487 isoform X1 [Haematobia irritans]|uniref:uncharacterized protein LOC142220487 isoform X1 n=1 Tax=Haematobia irritans TaxID=7368 RepID=UPI003F508B2A
MVNNLDITSKSGNDSNNSSIPAKEKPEWLTQDLFREFLEKDFPNFKKIKNFIVKPAVATGENYMTVLLRVNLSVEMPDSSMKTTSYMLKILPSVEKFKMMVKQWQVFAKELRTYTKLIPKFEEYYGRAGVKVKFAPCILEPLRTKIDDDLLILEDLRLKGFKNFNRHLGLDLLHTKAVLKKLAQFHAASAYYVDMEGPFPSLYDQCFSSAKDVFGGHRQRIASNFRQNLHLYGDVMHLEEKLKIYIPQQPDYYQTNFKHQPGEFQVLNHSDLWINNIMFQYHDDGSIKETYFIDYQMCRYGSPAQDLYYFLLSSIHIEIKIKYFDYFIAFYHRDLDENLKLLSYKGNIPTLKDLHVALLNHDYCGYSAVINPLPVALTQPQDDVNMDNMMSADDSHDVRKDMFRSESYVDHMRIILPWMVYRGIFDSQFV